MSNGEKYWVLLPAAGIGKRMGGQTPKQYLSIAGHSVLDWTLARLHQLENIEQILLILNPQDSHWAGTDLTKVVTTTGGNERFDSVMNGLKVLEGVASEKDWILVHDAVRPCVALSDIQKLMTSLEDDPVGGLLAIPVKDTLKRSVDDTNVIAETLDRKQFWLASTPQMFRYGVLRDAMENASSGKLTITDEASAVEALGLKVKLIEGRSDNIKITHQSDLALAEFLLKQSEPPYAI